MEAAPAGVQRLFEPSPAFPTIPIPRRPAHRRSSVVLTERQLKEVVEVYSGFDAFAFDFETRGQRRDDPRRAEPFWLSLAGPGRADVIPFGHPLGDVVAWDVAMTKDGSRPLKNRKPAPVHANPPEQLGAETVFGMLDRLFFGPAAKIGHGVKFDAEILAAAYGEIPPGPWEDTMIAAFLVDETHRGGRPYSLGSCVNREFRYLYDKSLGRIGVEKFPFSEAADYSWHDSRYAWLLRERYARQIEEAGLGRLYELEMDVLRCVVWMETAGVAIDEDGLDKLTARIGGQMDEVYGRVEQAAGWPINLNADAEIRRLLFEERGHTPHPEFVTEMRKDPQVSAAALQATPALRKDPVVKDVLKWLELHKIHATYLLNIKEMLNKGRIHADFDQRGARTGRFACRKPNLQNIPTRRSKELRELFVPAPGCRLIVADYSQIELRLLAHFTKDPLLIKAYQEGLNLHTITARRAYHVEEPTPEQYSKAKNCNFSMAYGAMAQTLVDRYGVPTLREAEDLIEAFFGTYTKVDPWRRRVVARCRATRVTRLEAKERGCRPSPPYVETILGRRRRLPDLFNPERRVRAAAERQAVNTKIQGSAGDLLKLAMVNVYGALAGTASALLLTVHDELVVETPEPEAEEIAALVKESMEVLELPVPLRVPLVADVKICDRWSEK